MIFSGKRNRELSIQICDFLHMDLSRMYIKSKNSSEVFLIKTKIFLYENVQNKNVAIIHSIGGKGSINNSFIELILLASALKHANASKIIAVIPYFGYNRNSKPEKSFSSLPNPGHYLSLIVFSKSLQILELMN